MGSPMKGEEFGKGFSFLSRPPEKSQADDEKEFRSHEYHRMMEEAGSGPMPQPGPPGQAPRRPGRVPSRYQGVRRMADTPAGWRPAQDPSVHFPSQRKSPAKPALDPETLGGGRILLAILSGFWPTKSVVLPRQERSSRKTAQESRPARQTSMPRLSFP